MAKTTRRFGFVEVTGLKKTKQETQNQIAKPRSAKAMVSQLEFAGATSAAKTFKNCLGPQYPQVADLVFFSKLQGKIRNIISLGDPSPAGPRSLLLSQNKHIFRDMETSKKHQFHYFFRACYELSISPNRTQIALEFGPALFARATNLPKSASHFQLSLAIGTFSDLLFDESQQAYIPKHPTWHGNSEQCHTNPIPINGQGSISLQHILQTMPETQLPEDVSLIIAMGINSSRSINGQFSATAAGKALCIHKVH